MLLSGVSCDDQRRHGASSPIQIPEVQPQVTPGEGPAEVTRALLEAIGEAQDAREFGLGSSERKQRYQAAMSRLRRLAAADAIYEQMTRTPSPTIPKDISKEALVTSAIESWVSTVAHYVDGFLFETLSIAPTNLEGATSASVYVEAERPEDADSLSGLQARAEIAAAKDAAGRPIPVGSPEYYKLVRAEGVAMRPPLNVPVRARIKVLLRRVDGAWRVERVDLGPGSLPSVATASAPVAAPTHTPAAASTTWPGADGPTTQAAATTTAAGP